MGGGCNYPIAVFSELKKNNITITGFYATDDGSCVVKEKMKAPQNQYMRISGEIAALVKQKCGSESKPAFRETASE